MAWWAANAFILKGSLAWNDRAASPNNLFTRSSCVEVRQAKLFSVECVSWTSVCIHFELGTRSGIQERP